MQGKGRNYTEMRTLSRKAKTMHTGCSRARRSRLAHFGPVLKKNREKWSPETAYHARATKGTIAVAG